MLQSGIAFRYRLLPSARLPGKAFRQRGPIDNLLKAPVLGAFSLLSMTCLLVLAYGYCGFLWSQYKFDARTVSRFLVGCSTSCSPTARQSSSPNVQIVGIQTKAELDEYIKGLRDAASKRGEDVSWHKRKEKLHEFLFRACGVTARATFALGIALLLLFATVNISLSSAVTSTAVEPSQYECV